MEWNIHCSNELCEVSVKLVYVCATHRRKIRQKRKSNLFHQPRLEICVQIKLMSTFFCIFDRLIADFYLQNAKTLTIDKLKHRSTFSEILNTWVDFPSQTLELAYAIMKYEKHNLFNMSKFMQMMAKEVTSALNLCNLGQYHAD